MTITFDRRNYQYGVTLTEEELKLAFTSENEFQLLLHNICKSTYGEELANKLFPVTGVADCQ